MTDTAISTIQETTSSLSTFSGKIPTILSKGVYIICKIHCLWRNNKQVPSSDSPLGFLALLGGWGLNWGAGDRRGVKIAAQAVLIALRMVECIEHFNTLHSCTQEVADHFTGRSLVPLKMTWKTPKGFIFLSPSTHHAIRASVSIKWYRTKQIACLIVKIAYHLFELSMCIIDANEALSPNSKYVGDNINGIFLNGIDLLEKLTTDLPYLHDQLIRNAPLIDKFIQKTNIPHLHIRHLLAVCGVAADLRQGVEDLITDIVGAHDSDPDLSTMPPKDRFIDDACISKPFVVQLKPKEKTT